MKNLTRKTTAREYKASYELLMESKREVNRLKREDKYCDAIALETQIKTFEQKYFDTLPTVPVKYSIGGRQYYRHAVKLGKSFFEHGRALNKSNGIWFVKEIEEITEKMQSDMLADSYYY